MASTRKISNNYNQPPTKLSVLLAMFGLSSSNKLSKSESDMILANAKADAQLTKTILTAFDESSAKSQETVERANRVLGSNF